MAAALLTAIVPVLAQSPGGGPPASRTPVLIELFTSEGCSSCPPSDAMLAALTAGQPFNGAEVIGLEMHVDYWDRQGWKDPFSSSAFTRRQQEYATALKVADIYTPQIVVDGTAQMAGTDEEAVRRAVADAGARPHVPVRITNSTSGNTVRLSIDVPPAPAGAERIDLFVALAEGGLVSRVLKGENSGRTLEHGAVVRRLESAGAIRESGFVTEAEWKLNPRWNRARLSAVVWLQGHGSRRIYGAASAPVR
jgi:hypothetical protein